MFRTSQPIATNIFERRCKRKNICNTCFNDCKQIFKNKRGLKKHSRTCKMTAFPSTLLHDNISSGNAIINITDT